MKAEVKWVGGGWRGFEDDRTHFSAGIAQVCALVEESLKDKALLAGDRIDVAWEARGAKLVAARDLSLKKMSKTDRG